MKKIRLSTAIALILLSVVTTVNATIVVNNKLLTNISGDLISMQSQMKKLQEITSAVDALYVGDINEKDVLDMASAGYIAGLGDEWSYYLTAEQNKQRKDDQKETLVGIGISVTYDTEKKAILVTEVYQDSPAFNSGINKLDYITSVDGTAVASITYEEAVDMVRGEIGTDVSLTVYTGEEARNITVTRDEVTRISVFSEMVGGNIGLIRISEFDSNTSEQFETAINDLKEQGATSFIFDVRNNPGGILTELVEMLDLLLPEGLIIKTEDKAGNITEYDSDDNYLNMPLTVLINENSYSAAEFFAAAIADYSVGTVIGEKTGGKGYSQITHELSDGSAIVISTNKYFTPNGRSLALTGVTPNIEVKLSDEEEKNFYFLTNETDPQILKAIETLSE